MGLAFLIVLLKIQALRKSSPAHDECARFWGRFFDGYTTLVGLLALAVLAVLAVHGGG
jgi:hypothetical protein